MSSLIRLDATDNVATAIRPLEVGPDGATEVIPRGQKMAVEAISKGAEVRKYATLIGDAAEAIPAGA